MAHELKLPVAVIGPADVGRLKRELDSFNEQTHQSELREKSGGKRKRLEPGKLLFDFAKMNDCDVTNENQRAELLEKLEDALKTAPIVTLSFAVDPSAALMNKMVGWLRDSTHPHVLVRIGLQPNIAAGCILRTSSKIYDFSLHNKFNEQRPMLTSRLRQLRQNAAPVHTLKAPSVEAPTEAEA